MIEFQPDERQNSSEYFAPGKVDPGKTYDFIEQYLLSLPSELEARSTGPSPTQVHFLGRTMQEIPSGGTAEIIGIGSTACASIFDSKAELVAQIAFHFSDGSLTVDSELPITDRNRRVGQDDGSYVVAIQSGYSAKKGALFSTEKLQQVYEVLSSERDGISSYLSHNSFPFTSPTAFAESWFAEMVARHSNTLTAQFPEASLFLRAEMGNLSIGSPPIPSLHSGAQLTVRFRDEVIRSNNYPQPDYLDDRRELTWFFENRETLDRLVSDPELPEQIRNESLSLRELPEDLQDVLYAESMWKFVARTPKELKVIVDWLHEQPEEKVEEAIDNCCSAFAYYQLHNSPLREESRGEYKLHLNPDPYLLPIVGDRLLSLVTQNTELADSLTALKFFVGRGSALYDDYLQRGMKNQMDDRAINPTVVLYVRGDERSFECARERAKKVEAIVAEEFKVISREVNRSGDPRYNATSALNPLVNVAQGSGDLKSYLSAYRIRPDIGFPSCYDDLLPGNAESVSSLLDLFFDSSVNHAFVSDHSEIEKEAWALV